LFIFLPDSDKSTGTECLGEHKPGLEEPWPLAAFIGPGLAAPAVSSHRCAGCLTDTRPQHPIIRKAVCRRWAGL